MENNSLTKDEIGKIVKFQKEIMELFGKHLTGISKEEEERDFLIFSYVIGLVLTNAINTFKLDKPEKFIKDVMEFALKINKNAFDNSSFMIFKNGEKKAEIGESKVD